MIQVTKMNQFFNNIHVITYYTQFSKLFLHVRIILERWIYIYTQLLDNFFRNLKSFPNDRSREKSESNTVGLFDSRFIRSLKAYDMLVRGGGEPRWIVSLPMAQIEPFTRPRGTRRLLLQKSRGSC